MLLFCSGSSLYFHTHMWKAQGMCDRWREKWQQNLVKTNVGSRDNRHSQTKGAEVEVGCKVVCRCPATYAGWSNLNSMPQMKWTYKSTSAEPSANRSCFQLICQLIAGYAWLYVLLKLPLCPYFPCNTRRTNVKKKKTLMQLLHLDQPLIFPRSLIRTSAYQQLQYFPHLRDCSRKRRWDDGPINGGKVTVDLSEVTDVVVCKVVDCGSIIMGPAAWLPHTFSTWGNSVWSFWGFFFLERSITWVFFIGVLNNVHGLSRTITRLSVPPAMFQICSCKLVIGQVVRQCCFVFCFFYFTR